MVLVLLGLIAVFSWTGLYFGPVLAIVAAALPDSVKVEQGGSEKLSERYGG